MVSATGLVLMVGHLLRFHPGVEKLRELIDTGELGDRPLRLREAPGTWA